MPCHLDKIKFILAVLFLALTLSGCDDYKAKDTEQGYEPEVEVLEIAPQDIPMEFEFPAKGVGYKETEIRARVGGILLKRNYTEGENVQKGDILFEIDPEPYKLELAQAEADLAEIEASLESAKANWNRISILFSQKIASEKSRDEAKSTLNSLKANQKRVVAGIDSAKLNLAYTKVTAPISGVTEMETYSEGSLITENSLLTRISQHNPIYIIFFLSENDALTINDMIIKGKLKDIKKISDITIKAKYGNNQIYSHNGRINFLNPNIDDATGTVKLRAEFPNPDGLLMPGQFLRVLLSDLVVKGAFIVPQTAVMQDGEKSYVYVVTPENTIKAVSVKTGLPTQNYYWIIDEGLNAGDKVVVSSLLQIAPDMKVNPQIVSGE